jgi:putative colanic acid biosynthesis acetyltransferase WcaF
MRDLGAFTAAGYDKGRHHLVQALWFAIMNTIFMAWWCPRRWRVPILRMFGAEIGDRVFIRHNVRVLWPWKLNVGDDSWIGEDVWLLNLEEIHIGSNVCLSQGAFLCTGSHDLKSPTFEYDNGPISLEDGVWVAAQAVVLRGVCVGREAVLGARSVIVRDVPALTIVPAAGRW